MDNILEVKAQTVFYDIRQTKEKQAGIQQIELTEESFDGVQLQKCFIIV